MPNQYLLEGHITGEKNDCVVISTSYCLNLTYQEAYDYCALKGRKKNKGMYTGTIFGNNTNKPKLLNGAEITFHDPTKKVSVKTFVERNPKGIFAVTVRGHVFVVYNAKVLNQWSMTQRIRQYWEIKHHENTELAIAKVIAPKTATMMIETPAPAFKTVALTVIFPKSKGLVAKIISLHISGLTNQQIIAAGFNKHTVNRQVREYKLRIAAVV